MTTRALSALGLVVATVLAGCAGGLSGDGPVTCDVSLGFTPSMPIAGPAGEVTVTATVLGTVGVLTYSWSVSSAAGTVTFDPAAANDSAIRFTALDPGIYTVTLDVDAPSDQCPQASERITVFDPSGTTLDVRLHVTPPFDLEVPPIDRLIRIYANTDYALGPVVLDPGVPVTGRVQLASSVGVPAYLRLAPQGMAGAVVETFSSSTGAFDVTLLNQPHEVLVVPSGPGLAPRRFIWTPGSQPLTVDAGTAISGFVRHGPNPIAGAKVQLTIDGVPTTLGTTAGDGSYTVLGVPASGAPVKVEVTPPAALGLPRLEAQGAFNVGGQVDVTYSASLATRNIAGTTVRRGGAALANRKVVIVGALAAVGTVQAGITATASGFTRITVTTDGGGALPSVLAPAGPLSAVVTVGTLTPTVPDLAVTPFDLSTNLPPTIDAPVMTAISPQVLGQVPLDGARLDLVPVGALALAGAPTLQLVGDATGSFAASIPGGGRFDAYFSDPAGRSGQRIVLDVTAAGLISGSEYLLDPAVSISGTLSVTGNPNRIRGASVQILCATCAGLGRDRPIAEVASDDAGDFVLAVPDPGTM